MCDSCLMWYKAAGKAAEARLSEPGPRPTGPTPLPKPRVRVEPIEDEAKRIVRGGQREADYGPPLQDFYRIALIWEAILGIKIPPEKVALCLQGVKTSRLVATPEHHDSMADSVGYMICYQRIVEGEPTND